MCIFVCVCACIGLFVCACVLQSLLALDHCVGIIGGKPKHSVYFVGFQSKRATYVYTMEMVLLCIVENKLVHLDPHYCQVATEPGNEPHYRNFDIKVLYKHIGTSWL